MQFNRALYYYFDNVTVKISSLIYKNMLNKITFLFTQFLKITLLSSIK